MLPVSPPPLSGEACTSWLARLAARYDLDGTGLNGALGIPLRMCWTQDADVPDVLARGLAAATGLPARWVRSLGLGTLLPALPLRWVRDRAAWCQACLATAVARTGEAHRLAAWALGFWVVCPRHRLPLSGPTDIHACCPRRAIGFLRRRGRLRLLCASCGAAHDEDPAGYRLEPQPARLAAALWLQRLLLRLVRGGANHGQQPGGAAAPAEGLAVCEELLMLAVHDAGLLRRPHAGETRPLAQRIEQVGGGDLGGQGWTPARLAPQGAYHLLVAAAPRIGAVYGATESGRGRMARLRAFSPSLPGCNLAEADARVPCRPVSSKAA